MWPRRKKISPPSFRSTFLPWFLSSGWTQNASTRWQASVEVHDESDLKFGRKWLLTWVMDFSKMLVSSRWFHEKLYPLTVVFTVNSGGLSADNLCDFADKIEAAGDNGTEPVGETGTDPATDISCEKRWERNLLVVRRGWMASFGSLTDSNLTVTESDWIEKWTVLQNWTKSESDAKSEKSLTIDNRAHESSATNDYSLRIVQSLSSKLNRHALWSHKFRSLFFVTFCGTWN